MERVGAPAAALVLPLVCGRLLAAGPLPLAIAGGAFPTSFTDEAASPA
jgi:hypothetical protein